MNFKTLVILAIFLIGMMVVSPVAAYAWQNGNYLTDERANEDAKLYTLNYDPQTGVTSKIRDAPKQTDDFSYAGKLHIQTLTHHSLIGKEFTIQRVDPTGMPGFTNGALVQKEFMDKFPKLGDEHLFELNHIGEWEDFLADAVFAVTLKDGDGGQPEHAMAKITTGYHTDIVFKGHAVSMPSEPVTSVVSGCPTVSSYGKIWLGYFFNFNVQNLDTKAKRVKIQYTVDYNKEIKCPTLLKGHNQPKCYEDVKSTFTDTLIALRYAPMGTSHHIGMIDYPTSKHGNEVLTSVIVKSCSDAACGDKSE